MEGNSRDQSRAHGSNGCKIVGICSVGTQQPPRGHYPFQHRMGVITNLGNRNQRRPPQDCIQIHIQSQPQRRFHLQGPSNPRHSRCSARSQESEDARGISGHGKSGDDEAPTIGTSSNSTTVPVGNPRGERKTAITTDSKGTASRRGRSKQKEKERMHSRRSSFP